MLPGPQTACPWLKGSHMTGGFFVTGAVPPNIGISEA